MTTNIANYIDHTLLKPQSTAVDIIRLCEEARQYGFASVCVPPYYVMLAKELLTNSSVAVCTVIGFPLGYNHSIVKLSEAQKAISDGAQEIDMVMNIGLAKTGNWNDVYLDILPIAHYTKRHDVLLKVILEINLLSDEEIVHACEVCTRASVDFVKTSTGFQGGASVVAVQLMRKNLPDSIQIKASGGIRDAQFARKLLEVGATRLGCSRSLAIIGV